MGAGFSPGRWSLNRSVASQLYPLKAHRAATDVMLHPMNAAQPDEKSVRLHAISLRQSGKPFISNFVSDSEKRGNVLPCFFLFQPRFPVHSAAEASNVAFL